MLTRLEIGNGIIAIITHADASAGEVLPGIATKAEIIDYCDSNLTPPFEDESGISFGSYGDLELRYAVEDGATVKAIRQDLFDGSLKRMQGGLKASARTIEGWEQGRPVPAMAAELIARIATTQTKGCPVCGQEIETWTCWCCGNNLKKINCGCQGDGAISADLEHSGDPICNDCAEEEYEDKYMNPHTGTVQTRAEWRSDAENDGWDFEAADLAPVRWDKATQAWVEV